MGALISVARELCVAIQVVTVITKEHLRDSRPFNKEPYIKFIGHSDTAMHLYGFIGGESLGVYLKSVDNPQKFSA